MPIYMESTALSPYAKLENYIARSPLSEFSPCPGCGEPIRYRYECHMDAPPKMILECPDCGTYSIVPGRIDNGDRVVYKVLETGEDYNNGVRIDAVKARLEALGDGCPIRERARLTAELAWESKIRSNDLLKIWSESVELFRDAVSAGEDAHQELTEAVLRFIPMAGDEVRDVTADAARLLIGCSDAPSTARECAVWLWYASHDINSLESQSEPDDDISAWNIAKDAFLAMPEDERLTAPRLSSLMDLWEFRLVDYLDNPNCISSADSCSSLLRSAMDRLYASLDAGVSLEPAHFDLLLDCIQTVVSYEEDEDVLNNLLEHKGLFGNNADIIESFVELVSIQMNLCESALAFDLLFSGLREGADEGQVIAVENLLKRLEEHVSLEYAGRTMIQAYLLFGLMTRDRGCIEYAEVCARNLDYRHQDYADFYGRIYRYAETLGFHKSARSTRKSKARNAKEVRKAHAARRRAERESRR